METVVGTEFTTPRLTKTFERSFKMSSEYIKHNGNKVKKSSIMARGKRYRYNKQGAIEEITASTALTADDFVISGTKSSLRRISDLEQNVAMIYTRLTTADGETAAASESSDDISVGRSGTTTRFKGNVRFEKHIDARSGATVGTTFADKVIAQSNAYVNVSVSNDTLTFTTGDGATKSVTTSDANSNTYVTGASFNTTDGVLTLTRNSGSVTVDLDGRYQAAGSYALTGTSITAGNGLTGGGSLAANRTINVGGGNGITVTADGVAMSGSYTGTFTASGDVCAYSDASLKTNVKTIEGALDKVAAVRGVTFDRIADGSTSAGVIAQELEAVLPEAVKTDEDGVKMVAYGNITGLLIEAVKELSAQVEELKKNQK